MTFLVFPNEGAISEDRARLAVDRARQISRQIPKSPAWQPLVRNERAERERGFRREIWENGVYCCDVDRHEAGWPLDGGPWVAIGVSAVSGQPRHDWREFQHIKNDIVGAEWEAVELYPAESRLLDPSNYFLLWCAPKIPLGMFGRRAIADESDCTAPQRGWHES